MGSNQPVDGLCYKNMVKLLRTVAWQTRAAWMLLTSLFKKKWTIEDYPIRFKFHQITKTSNASRLKPLPWSASVVNWPAMSGRGYTRLEAFGELRKHFEGFKATEGKLPRPGTRVRLRFATRDRVQQYPKLAKEFFREMLQVDGAWISDESSLWDFHGDETNEKLIAKIRQIYGVDVSDIRSGNLAEIFDRITKSRRSKGAKCS